MMRRIFSTTLLVFLVLWIGLKSAAMIRGPHTPHNVSVRELHRAAELGNVPEIKIQLSAGIPINGTDPHGWTPLMTAVHAGQLEAAKALITAGADVNAKA